MEMKFLHFKRFLVVALLAMMTCLTNLGFAQDEFTVGGINYSVNSDGSTVTATGHVDGTSATGNLIIPATVAYGGTTYRVTDIEPWSFSNTNFGGVLLIPETIKAIGVAAFFSSTFSEVRYNALNAEVGASKGGPGSEPTPPTPPNRFPFGACYCSTLIIGENVEVIVHNMFESSAFSDVYYNANNAFVDETNSSPFTSTTANFLGNLYIGENVEFLNDYMFTSTNFNTIYFNAVGAEIGRMAPFEGLGGQLVIGNSVEYIGSEMFSGVLFTGNLMIPNSVTAIYDYAFADCAGFTSLTLGDNIEFIGGYAFAGCSGLTGNLYIPNSVLEIYDYAFADCNGLDGTLTIGTSLEFIYESAFSGCSNFSHINYNATNCLCQIGSGINPDYFYTAYDEEMFPFYACTGSLTIGDNVESIPDYIFCYSDLSGDLTIGESVTSIGEFAFKECAFDNIYYNATNCNDFEPIKHNYTNPNGSTQIGLGITSPIIGMAIPEYTYYFYPFWGCQGYVIIGDNVEYIPEYMFAWGSFNGISIGDSVETIGEYAFYGCCFLPMGGLTIPTSVTSIGTAAFSSCYFTGHLIIGSGLTEINSRVFSSCSAFTGSLTIPNSVTTIGFDAFGGCVGFNGSLTIGNSVETIGAQSFFYCGFTGDLIIPSSVKSIETNAFFMCSGFAGEDLLIYMSGAPEIGKSVNGIGDYAFADCGFSNVFFLNRLPPSENYSFGDMYSTAILYYPIEFPMNYAEYWGDGSPSKFDNTVAARYYTSDGNWTRYELYNAGVSEEGWAYGYPEDDGTEHVVVIADCDMRVSKNIEELYIVRDGHFTIESNKVLNVNGKVTNRGDRNFLNNNSFIGYGNLMLKDGAQLVNNTEGVRGKVEKEIVSNDAKGDPYWQFVASPIKGENKAIYSVSGSSSLTGDTDETGIYRFNQAAELEWENKSNHNFDYENGKGYLVTSNKFSSMTINGEFCLANDKDEYDNELDYVAVPLAYSEENSSVSMWGWNLIGNPFPSDAYIDMPYYVVDSEGLQLEPNAKNTSIAIPSCAGVMVKANEANVSAHFTRTAPDPATAQNNGSLSLTARRMNQRTREMDKIDKVIVSFNEGGQLPKFVLKEDEAHISIMQDGKAYGLASSDKSGSLPLRVEVPELGFYTLSVDIDEAELFYLHLIDKLTGDDVDLLVEPEYSFTAKKNDDPNRFMLVFKGSMVEPGDDIFAYQNGSDIIVDGEGELQIFDVMGRMVKATAINGIETINMPENGVYIFRMVGNDIKTQKIVVR